MGRKNVIFCDLCKHEVDEETLSSLTFKKPGKKNGNKYEICSECAQKIQVQLVGENKLGGGWNFGSNPVDLDTGQNQPPPPAPAAHSSDDDEFVASKLDEVRKRREAKMPETKPGKDEDGKCLHYNRSTPLVGNYGGKEGFIQTCRDCNAVLPLRKAEERHSIAKTGD